MRLLSSQAMLRSKAMPSMWMALLTRLSSPEASTRPRPTASARRSARPRSLQRKRSQKPTTSGDLSGWVRLRMRIWRMGIAPELGDSVTGLFVALEHRFHAVNQFLQAERFGYVVVHFGNVQTQHLIDILGFGSHHNDRDLRGSRFGLK